MGFVDKISEWRVRNRQWIWLTLLIMVIVFILATIWQGPGEPDLSDIDLMQR